MFTGIIQHIGTVQEVIPVGDGKRFQIDVGEIAATLRSKDSLAVNGTCLTIEDSSGTVVQMTAIRQTLQITTLDALQTGNRVNLEPAATLGTFLGGHLVQGHIDGIAVVREVLSRETGCEIVIDFPRELMRYIIDKGSIALDGVSLTVAEKQPETIRIAIIPETLERTILSNWEPGTQINVEVDPIGKYVENFLRGMTVEEGATPWKK